MASFLFLVYISRVTKTDVLKYLGKRHSAYLNNQVQMIGHQAKCMEPVTVSFNAFLEWQIKPGPVCLGIKNFLAAVAVKYNMIKSAGIMDTRFANHN